MNTHLSKDLLILCLDPGLVASIFWPEAGPSDALPFKKNPTRASDTSRFLTPTLVPVECHPRALAQLFGKGSSGGPSTGNSNKIDRSHLSTMEFGPPGF